jgi:hypothetical protein
MLRPDRMKSLRQGLHSEYSYRHNCARRKGYCRTQSLSPRTGRARPACKAERALGEDPLRGRDPHRHHRLSCMRIAGAPARLTTSSRAGLFSFSCDAWSVPCNTCSN